MRGATDTHTRDTRPDERTSVTEATAGTEERTAHTPDAKGEDMARKSRREREAVYVISVAADLAGVHPQTLRIYERRGLIKPYRTPGGTRRYSAADLERLAAIQELTDAGVNLEGVKRILELREHVARLERRVASLEEDLERARREAERELRRLRRSQRAELMVRQPRLPDVRRRLDELFGRD